MDWMERTLAPDFFEFGRSGRIYSREDTLGLESQPIDARLPLKNFEARLLSPDVALVTYISAVTYNGVEDIGNRSSIWSRTKIGWQLRFHQGTPVTTLTCTVAPRDILLLKARICGIRPPLLAFAKPA